MQDVFGKKTGMARLMGEDWHAAASHGPAEGVASSGIKCRILGHVRVGIAPREVRRIVSLWAGDRLQ
jgi:hypothetical protein